MESLLVDQHPRTHVPVDGPVLVRLHIGTRDFPPNIRPVPDPEWEEEMGFPQSYRSHRYIEFEALSPSLAELDQAARFLRNKYYRGTTHIAFETIEISTSEGRTVLDLGYGS